MSADINEVFKMNEIIRILKYKREKTRRDPIETERYLSVRRRLVFGDHNTRLAEGTVKRELSLISQKNKEKWNFDFENETPEELNRFSRFKWEPAQEKKVIYQRPSVPSKCVQRKITDYLGKRKAVYPSTGSKLVEGDENVAVKIKILDDGLGIVKSD